MREIIFDNKGSEQINFNDVDASCIICCKCAGLKYVIFDFCGFDCNNGRTEFDNYFNVMCISNFHERCLHFVFTCCINENTEMRDVLENMVKILKRHFDEEVKMYAFKTTQDVLEWGL